MDLTDTIETAAGQPAKAKGDQGEIEQRPLTELIEADKYLKGAAAANSGSRGLRFSKLVPPGAA